MVKPGIKKLAINRGKEINKEKRSELNLLLLRQCYLTRKIQKGKMEKLAELKTVQLDIQQWYIKECEKIKIQSKVNDVQESEAVRIYHHDIHRKLLKKSAILKLQTNDKLFEGHKECSKHLESVVAELLLNPAVRNIQSENVLLQEVTPVFTQDDNNMLLATPTKKEVEETLKESNLHAAPGTDGITSYTYKECWHILGDSLTEVARAVFDGHKPTTSQRTSLMVFGAKPKKPHSLKPSDKRRKSLLNSDFKTITGIEARRFKKVATHTLSPHQLVAGDNRRIHHGIAKARDAIFAAGKQTTPTTLLLLTGW